MKARQYIETLLRDFVQEKGFEWPAKANVEPPKDKQFGDMASNLALVLSGQAQQKPRDLAEQLRATLMERSSDLAAVDVAGPGFLNFTLTPEFWHKTVGRVLEEKDAYGAVDVGQGKKVQIEYVSANPTGPLHIGHGRGAALGDSLARILRFTGFDVSTEYYINDAGRQMRLLGTAVWVRLQQSQGKEVELPEECYKGDYIKDIAASVLAQHADIMDKAEDEALALCGDYAMSSILDGIKTDLKNFRVGHDVWFSEKSLVETGRVEKTLNWLKEKGLGYEQDGAFWFKATDLGDDKDRVLRKSDGSLTYFASDIAYHDDKYRRGFELLVDIWGADHHGYVPRMRAAIEALGKEQSAFEVLLVQLVNLLRGGEQIAMSTRAGKFETLADVCEEVGADAARFMFLSRRSDSQLDFDLELVKQRTMDNPVYYVQYAHARICSLKRKAEERGIFWPADALQGALPPEAVEKLNTPEDLQLLQLLARFSDALTSSVSGMSPHFVSYFLSELAGKLHKYYSKNPILVAPDEETMQARMLLMAATGQVIKNGLALLGVSAPEQM